MRHGRVLWAALFAAWAFLLQPTAPIRGPAAAQASVAVALSLQELVNGSERAVVAEVLEQQSRWEQVEGGRRIVTYSKLGIAEAVFGKADDSPWVRTLGGVVGKIGQHVSGEAQLSPGKQCVLFLTAAPDGVLVVAGRAQGHYPIATDPKGRAKLRASPDRGKVLPRRGPTVSAYEALVGRKLGTALSAIHEARKRRDARR